MQLCRQKITVFLYHSFLFYQNREFFLCTLAWYFLVKINTINKYIVTDFMIKTYAAHISELLIYTFKRFASVCNHGSSEFSLRVIASVEVTYPSSVSSGDATSYAPDFLFLFLIWSHGKHLSCFKLSSDILLILTLTPWCSGYHYFTTSFHKGWTQVMCRFKYSSRHVRDLRWWESPTVVSA